MNIGWMDKELLCHDNAASIAQAKKIWEEAEIRITDKLLELIDTDQEILEVGCGWGNFAKYVYDKGYKNLVLSDLHPLPSQFYPEVEVFKTDAHKISETWKHFSDEKVDVIYASHILEHLYSPVDALIEWRKVLKPHGYLCILVPRSPQKPAFGHLFNFGDPEWLTAILVNTGYDCTDIKLYYENYSLGAICKNSTQDVRNISSPTNFLAPKWFKESRYDDHNTVDLIGDSNE